MPGEFDLIDLIRDRVHARGGRIAVGSGDDAAVVRTSGVSVTSVDAFVEGVHFRLATTSMGDLGHKCLAASVSDLAAMGAAPGEAFFALGLPAQLGEREVLELTDGAEALAARLGMTICGGDMSAAAELFVAVTVVGHAESERSLVYRDGLNPGDRIGITGSLGGAGAGHLLLERKAGGLDADSGSELLRRHLRPWPLIEAGRALAAAGATGMIDVSDGIASDAAHLARRSGVQVEIDLALLPLDEGVEAVARAAGLDAVALAATAGEDYELLFAVPAHGAGRAQAAALAAGSPVTWIGEAREGSGLRLLGEDGAARPLHGWDHFVPPGPGTGP